MPESSSATVREIASSDARADVEIEAVEILLKSRSFDRAALSRQLLTYLWVHRTKELTEYTLAVEALGRRPDFDPKIDATVRVQISRLRQRLHDFYQSHEAIFCPVLLSIPIGTHQLQVTQREAPTLQTGAAPQVDVPIRLAPIPQATRLTYMLGGIEACLFAVLLGMVFFQLRGAVVRPAETHTPESLFWLWSGFLGHGKPTRIVLPTPTFFALDDDKQQLRVRDLNVNDFSDWQKSEALKRIASTFPDGPKTEVSYMVASDTFAAISLARYLDRSAYGVDVQFGSSGSAAMDDLDHENEIILGSFFTLRPFLSYTSQLPFQMEPFERAVSNRNPLPGEPKRLEEKIVESRHRSTQPGIIAILPGKNSAFHLMILQARHTSALVSFLTSSAGADELQKLWKQKGSPAGYEVVVYSEMIDDHPVKTSPVLLHVITQR